MSDYTSELINKLGKCDFLEWCVGEWVDKDSVPANKFPSYYIPAKLVST